MDESVINLPGRYAFHEEFESRKVTVTFQTYHELIEYMTSQELVPPNYPKPDVIQKVG